MYQRRVNHDLCLNVNVLWAAVDTPSPLETDSANMNKVYGLKSKGFLASGLSAYVFSTSSLYTTLPHNLIKEKLT